jgi:hypothetical protein
MSYLRFFFCVLFLPAYSASAESPKTVDVVELFTSQGCYSCPPADVFLGELAQRDEVIALSCHVTYWNYLGWEDTFSQPFCDNRQRQYQSVLKGYKGVYTPQMVINGRYGGVGSQRAKIQGLIAYDHQQNTAVRAITLRVEDQLLSVSLPSVADLPMQKRQLFLIGTTGNHWLPIKSGENSGKRLPYINPIEYVKNMGEWDGEARLAQWVLPNNTAIKDWVVVAQQWPVGAIVAAGKIKPTGVDHDLVGLIAK